MDKLTLQKTLRVAILLLLMLGLTGLGCAGVGAPRPGALAGPACQADREPGPVRVSDRLYRSGQPDLQELLKVKALGIKTVVNLRSCHSDCAMLGSLGLAYEQIPMEPWHPEEEDAVAFLKIVTDPKRTPVLVHCWHGADRTGALVAVYRIAVEGWSKEAAIREMTKGGFGFHRLWVNLPHWIRGLNIDRIRREAGITSLAVGRSAKTPASQFPACPAKKVVFPADSGPRG
jgi:protein tyrosine phosphatase (PTP) superfamily phosphohydrolase (DUF442 family)